MCELKSNDIYFIGEALKVNKTLKKIDISGKNGFLFLLLKYK